MTTTKNNATWERLLAAAEALLDARANQMVTAVEWKALRDAVRACRPDEPQVDARDACPNCGERRQDQLVWVENSSVANEVECGSCGMVYRLEHTSPA